MFKKILDEMIAAETDEQILDILYRIDGVDMSYQDNKLTWNDFERLFKLADRLMKH